jgi:hypothetical protein
MKIILISDIVPTPDNFHAASALPYHLAKYRPQDIELTIYSFNMNKVPTNVIQRIGIELNAKIHIKQSNKWISLLFKTHTIFLKNFLPYPFNYYNYLNKKTLQEIETLNPNGVWIHGDGLSIIAKQTKKYRRVMTMPDCVPLYYHRLMADPIMFHSLLRLIGTAIQYYKNLRMEQQYDTENIIYHLVGEVDRQYLLKINSKANAKFIRHPHYNIATKEKIIHFSQPKIKILIAGQNNLYMQSEIIRIIPALCYAKDLSLHYSLTFLGKGWENAVKELIRNGWEACQIKFVDVYLDEIIKYDIQLTPISIGTGTKGKVLDALANGLLEIGSPYALENIAVEDGLSCIIYKSEKQLLEILRNIPKNVNHYEEIATIGRQSVLKYHNRKTISKELFSLFNNKSSSNFD